MADQKHQSTSCSPGSCIGGNGARSNRNEITTSGSARKHRTSDACNRSAGIAGNPNLREPGNRRRRVGKGHRDRLPGSPGRRWSATGLHYGSGLHR
jgi:hypothetical protein